MDQLVSIIIPTYNREHLIGETLDAVLCQTYTNWECIVIDDGSIDNTKELMQSYSKNDERIKFYTRPDYKQKGASSCRNYGLEKSNGNYIQFLDSDDIISKEKLEIQVRLLEEDPCNSLATCKWGRFKSDLREGQLFEQLKSYNDFFEPLNLLNALGNSGGFFPIHAYLIRRSIITKAGYWNEYLSLNDDAEFMLRIIINSERICFAANCHAYYRFPQKDNLSSYSDERKVIDAINSWKLIEAHLKIRFKKDNFYFFEKAKHEFYLCAKIFPDVIKSNKDFFRASLLKEASWMRKIFLWK